IAEYYPVMGNKFKLPDDATLEVLHPFESMFGQKTDDPNDTSIVTRLRYQGITMLFTGDISQEVERALLSQKVDWRSDLLKVAHHGSGDSSIEEFIRAVSPAVSVIQVGEDNSYGHPAKRVLDTLEKAGSRVFRNDELGDIVVRVSLDGKMVVGDP
ncbi:MAG: MBL fold metallo-hydrolase, partial [bacterium]|nr:MBL fold metallo-hydrolase [bacterium]